MLSCFRDVGLFAALWIVACQAPLSMGFFRQENWSGLPFPSPGDLPDPGSEPASAAGRSFITGAIQEACTHGLHVKVKNKN